MRDGERAKFVMECVQTYSIALTLKGCVGISNPPSGLTESWNVLIASATLPLNPRNARDVLEACRSAICRPVGKPAQQNNQITHRYVARDAAPNKLPDQSHTYKFSSDSSNVIAQEFEMVIDRALWASHRNSGEAAAICSLPNWLTTGRKSSGLSRPRHSP
jgi:hypothetical protein